MDTEQPLPRTSDVLFEGGGVEGRPLPLTPARVAVLWDRMSRFPILFAGPKETSFGSFREVLEKEDSILVGFHSEDEPREPIGIGMIYDIEPGVEAKFQLSFFDQRLKGRESVVRHFIAWLFSDLLVRRATAHVRADARSMRAFLERVGMYPEGVLKNRIQKGKRFYDLYLYGICEHECDDLWSRGRSWAKPRIRLLEVYETK